MDILVDVSNQKLRVASNLKSLVSGTQEFVKFIFNLTQDWDDLIVFAQFKQGETAYNQYLDEENSVFLPSEITPGTCTLMLYGAGGTVKATTNYLTLFIDKNILVEDAQSTEITQSLYDQLIEKIEEMNGRVDGFIAMSEDEQVNLGGLGWEIADARRSSNQTYGSLGTAIRGQIRDVKSSITDINEELIDIRTGEDGTEYDTAGNAVRGQIRDLKNSVASEAEFLAEVGVEYEGTEEVSELVSDLRDILETASSFDERITNLETSIVDYIPDNSIGADKLTPALKRPSTSISSGTVAEMLWCAESYFNEAYTLPDETSTFLYEQHTGLYSESLGANEESGQYGIVCSSFVDAILNAITYKNSRYSTKNDINTKASWGVEFDGTGNFGTTYSGQTSNDSQMLIDNKYLTSQNLARYAAEHGYLFQIDGNENLRAGDVVFSGNVSGRYLGIDHVAFVVNTDGEYCTVLEAWPCNGETDNEGILLSADHEYETNVYHTDACKLNSDGTVSPVGLRINYHKLISDYTYGATFPMGSVDNEFILKEAVYGKSGNTESASLIHQSDEVEQGFYTVVCHGKFDKHPYVSIKYTDLESSTYQSSMHKSGDDYYLTVYVQRPATISVRMTTRKNDDYAVEETTYAYRNATILLYKGYAEITSQTTNSETKIQNLEQLAETVEEDIFGIRKGQMLSGADTLNTFECGVMYCNNATDALRITGVPTSRPDGGFRCETSKMNAIGEGENGRYIQKLWYLTAPQTMYIRMYTSNGWTNWFAFTGTEIV